MAPTKVVIADDHTLFREGIKRMLSLEKDILVVGEASRGDEVAKLVERTKPDVLLLDLKMPKIDGLEVLRTIKNDANLKPIPVVMLTSSREERDLAQSYALGANAYVVKPVEFQQFISAVKELGVFWGVLNEPPPEGS